MDAVWARFKVYSSGGGGGGGGGGVAILSELWVALGGEEIRWYGC
jgi:hypothetical protein